MSHEELLTLCEAIPQQVWTAKPDGELDFVNGRILEYFGRTHEEMTGNEWLEVVHPDDRPQIIEQWTHSVKTGEPYEVEFRLRHGADGTYRWNLGRALPVRDKQGHIIKWFGTNTDITDHKLVEEERSRALQMEREMRRQEAELLRQESVANQRLSFLAEASEIFSSSLDYETTLLNVVQLAVPKLADWCSIVTLQSDGTLHPIAVAHEDPAMLELAEELRRDYPTPLDAPHGSPHVIRTGRSELYEVITDAMLASRTVNERHLELCKKLKIRSAMIVPLTVRGNTFGAMTMVSSNPSRPFTQEDLRFAENLAVRAALSVENARLYNEAQRASQAKDHFLAVLSHELRTPLTPVLMAASAIEKDQLLPSEFKADISMIRRNVELEARLIDDLLDLTTISNGKVQLQSRSVNANELVIQADLIVRSELEPTHPRVALDLQAKNAHVEGDSTRMQQIFWNLLKNAVKFTPPEGEVRVTTSNPTSDTWRLEVADTGKGISQEELPHIFNAFEQGNRLVSKRFGGLGLGLAISKALADLHGGTLSATSDGIGSGAKFVFEMPLDLTPADRTPSFQTPPATDRPSGMRILLVEDHESTGSVMIRLLKKRGYHPLLASSLSEAFKLAKNNEFDLVISDLGLPDGTGFELMRELKARYDLRGIALSGYGMEEDVQQALEAGFMKHFTKPVNLEQLDEALQEFFVIP